MMPSRPGGEGLDGGQLGDELVADRLNPADDLGAVGLDPATEVIQRMADLAHGRLAERLEDLLGLLLERGEAILERGRRVDEVVDALAGVGADGVQQRLEVEDVVADRL